MGEVCRHCGSGRTRRNGVSRGSQRYLCRGCGRSFGLGAQRFGDAVRAQALRMHLNNVGIRKIALFLGCSPASVINWIKAAHRRLASQKQQAGAPVPDVIEMDEIYTFVQKNDAGP